MNSLAKFLGICLVAISLQQTYIDASKILFLLPVATPSHHVFMRPFFSELITRGHQLTLITGFSQFQMENMTIIHLKLTYNTGRTLNSMAYGDFKAKPFQMMLRMEEIDGMETCREFVQNEELQEQIKNGVRYDVVFATAVIEDCNFPIASLLSDKIIYLNFFRLLLPQLSYNLGIVAPYSFTPHVLTQQASLRFFFERFVNAFASAYNVFIFKDYSTQNKIIQQYFPQAPNIEEAFKKTTLIFSNFDTVLSEQIPRMGNIIPIGGMQCRKPQPVSKEFEQVLSGKNGFIVFSLGTLAEMKNAGPEILQAFIDAFAMVKETVIWKTREKYENLAPNIKTYPWIPQQDILGHSNVRLFITQGGIFGLQEAVYNAVPVLGIPLIVEQFSNMKRIEDLGIGKRIYMFDNLTADVIYNAIRSIIDNKNYKKNAEYYSHIFKDIDSSALDRAIFWTELVTRHSKLDPVVRPYFQNFCVFEYFMVDVIVFLISVLLISFFLIIKCGNKIVKFSRK